ncbi:MAG: FHA domain-containing protein [Deltaproteobacteria bacterium]|nr:FHA domain-containing protein [Deltaproteobacteria bacterium]
MFKLVIQDDEGKTTVVPLIRDEITIGRKEGNTIRLTERNVSRRHARIMRSNGHITIEDLDSYNGIKLNGNKIEGKSEVTEADRVQIGDYLIEVRREGQDSIDAVSDDAETRPIPTAPAADVDPMAATPVPEQATVPMPQVQPEPDQPARVVILSSNFAGQEWVLDKSRLVIGRTDENDVWINHRSISRHHAELVEENGRWSIVDLQSSNGVRVNGEDYGKVELRRGDIVDLGHVRLRFVEAGEDFVFGRDAQAVDIAGGGGGRSMGLILLVLLLVGGGIGAFVLMGKDKKQQAGKGADIADAQAVAAATTDAAPAESPIDAAAVDSNKELADLLTKAREAVEAESWVEAEKFAKQVLKLEAESTEAAAIEQKALLEKSNLVYYDEFRSRANVPKPKYKEAVRLYDRISVESIYKDRAKADFDKLKTLYLQRTTEAAQQMARAKKCAELKRLKQNAKQVFADAEAALRPIRCKAVAATNNTNKPDKPDKPDPVRPPPDKIDVQAALAKARRAAMSGQYGAARNACESILRQESGNVDARTICLVAACALKRAKSAKRHYRRLPASRKGWAVQQCFNHGIELGN